jgi:hypothetical protein
VASVFELGEAVLFTEMGVDEDAAGVGFEDELEGALDDDASEGGSWQRPSKCFLNTGFLRL